VDPATPLGCQEVFGPVMCLVSFATLDEAIARVNATPYGLATGIFTNRLNDALRAVRLLEVGGVHINETPSSRVDLMPYGGSKDSGFGREGPHYAIREMSEERMVTLLP
jgi:succinate-semialdehyde dehydrogenase/glutarate-semialdehyde dehydrogenase